MPRTGFGIGSGPGFEKRFGVGHQAGVFSPMVDGRELAAGRLDQLVHIDTFWFAWIAFHPSSSVAG